MKPHTTKGNAFLTAYGVLVMYTLDGYGSAIQENAAMLVGMGTFMVLNYLGQRTIVFKEKEERNESIL